MSRPPPGNGTTTLVHGRARSTYVSDLVLTHIHEKKMDPSQHALQRVHITPAVRAALRCRHPLQVVPEEKLKLMYHIHIYWQCDVCTSKYDLYSTAPKKPFRCTSWCRFTVCEMCLTYTGAVWHIIESDPSIAATLDPDRKKVVAAATRAEKPTQEGGGSTIMRELFKDPASSTKAAAAAVPVRVPDISPIPQKTTKEAVDNKDALEIKARLHERAKEGLVRVDNLFACLRVLIDSGVHFDKDQSTMICNIWASALPKFVGGMDVYELIRDEIAEKYGLRYTALEDIDEDDDDDDGARVPVSTDSTPQSPCRPWITREDPAFRTITIPWLCESKSTAWLIRTPSAVASGEPAVTKRCASEILDEMANWYALKELSKTFRTEAKDGQPVSEVSAEPVSQPPEEAERIRQEQVEVSGPEESTAKGEIDDGGDDEEVHVGRTESRESDTDDADVAVQASTFLEAFAAGLEYIDKKITAHFENDIPDDVREYVISCVIMAIEYDNELAALRDGLHRPRTEVCYVTDPPILEGEDGSCDNAPVSTAAASTETE